VVIMSMAVVVAFHAHPDDEALLFGGTLARLVAEGHRVVLVVATDGEMGEARPDRGTNRLDELHASAAVLGVSRVVHLGYADSGHGPVLYADPPDRPRFGRASPEEAAGRLAEVLREEQAEILIGNDPNGGNRHPDHIRVHEVARRAAKLAGTPRLMEATRPREPTLRVYKVANALRLIRQYDEAELRGSYTARADITHRVNVRRYAGQKRAALASHASQLSGTGRSAKTFGLMVKLPVPVYALILGREYYTEVGEPRPWLD
jgi:LmbE family N-acetylglucosaminyl deacetylase